MEYVKTLYQAISEKNRSRRKEMVSLKTPSSRREMASLQTYQAISENNPSSRSEMALLNNRHLITTDLSSHLWGESIKQKRNGVALGVFNCCMLRLSRRMVTVVSIS
ncbi:unnamed protein product [Cylindrotheca closterium]|uniref:Uncharacterized protein n=1 Tax=Cylindrotheca closterium TaxID=2856 RepID=A0AAD2PWG5_9STRA|nr:unnamed protein product [Cylindrotheca closterium]CAJ1960604.1 unnamed protein product [Cylindrotheca closterium]